MKVLFDTNVLLAAFLTEGLCWKLLLRANRGEFSLCTSPYILEEFKTHLAGKLGFSLEETRESINLITEIAQISEPEEKSIRVKGVCRDKKDDLILASALASEAEFLVTGDSDLLSLKKFQKIRILSPREFEMLLLGILK